ncbi:MAG: N-6 DNA methylase [Nitrospira sp.]|nr:N-6 DNA methylase [Nitrospira sp.]
MGCGLQHPWGTGGIGDGIRQRELLVNAAQVFTKGTHKNSIPEDSIERRASTVLRWQEEEKFSRIVEKAGITQNDCNISPSRYIHTAVAKPYRPVGEIVAELNAVEAKARRSDAALKKVLTRLGFET